VLELAARFSQRPDSATATILGGLTAALLDGDALVYRPLSTSALHVAVVVPELNTYLDETARARPERLPLTDALYNLSRIPLLVDAFRDGDLRLLEQVMDDRVHFPYFRRFIPGCDHVTEMARRAGAVAITLSGTGPALVAFAESDHRKVALAMEVAFENVGVRARSWVLPIDTQGVVVSVTGS
jgi:homoserine kinase